MNTFKHSGAIGDLVYSLSTVKHFNGGKFYLHLNQIDWIGQHYYGSKPDPYHQGHLNEKDFEYMKEFMLYQQYINSFEVYDSIMPVTYDLDEFRKLFVYHPGNYIDIYSSTFRITDDDLRKQIRTTPWLTAPMQPLLDGRTVVINRTQRWIPKELNPQWGIWKEEGIEDTAIFVGLPNEYELFKKQTSINIPYVETKNMLELAATINSAELFIGNQSQALAIAVGLGKPFYCEIRRDLPKERNECWFPENNGDYF